MGFYYSLIDWHHPDFPIDILHPYRNSDDVASLNEGRDMRRYAAYMRDQVRELLGNYGQIEQFVVDRIPVSYTHLDVYKRQS